MNKYTWEHSKDAELWQHDLFETIDDCIQDAVDGYEYKKGETIYVGEPVTFVIDVDADDVLERIAEQAFDFAGEAAENWQPSIEAKVEDLKELSEQLSKVVQDWLVKHSLEPYFYQITNVKAVEIGSEAEL